MERGRPSRGRRRVRVEESPSRGSGRRGRVRDDARVTLEPSLQLAFAATSETVGGRSTGSRVANACADLEWVVRGTAARARRGGCGGWGVRSRRARADDRRPADRRRHALLRHRRDRPQPSGWRREGEGALPRGEGAGVEPSSSRSATTGALHPRAFDSPYDNENSFGATYGQHREALELDRERFASFRRTRASSTRLLRDGVRRGERRPARRDRPAGVQDCLRRPANTPLLRHVATFGKPLIVSTGGATLEDVDRAVETVLPINSELCLLQCTAAYPAAFEELDLGVIKTFASGTPTSSSASPTTRTGSRWHSSPTCSALG